MVTKTSTKLFFSKKNYPTFGRGPYNDQKPPSTVTSSPFFWWFKFLQLNEDYKTTELNRGKGVCSEIYKDFGNISNVDFKTWWSSHSHLFAEKPTKFSLKVAKDNSEIAPFNSSDAVNVVVPLNWSPTSLKKQFSLLVDKLYKVESTSIMVGESFKQSEAKYQINGRCVISAFENAYNAYTIRLKHLEKGPKITTKQQFKGAESKKFQVSWSEIAVLAKIKLDKSEISHKSKLDKDEKRLMAIRASQHAQKALVYITNAASTHFPF